MSNCLIQIRVLTSSISNNYSIISKMSSVINKKRKRDDEEIAVNEKSKSKSDDKKKKGKGIWFEGLVSAMKDPNKVVQKDDLITVIKDAFPKAQYHYLILPNEDIKSLKHVNKEEHLSLLKHMQEIGEQLANKHDKTIEDFLIGYHAEPSMARLHLHVISDDFNSPCLKTKKHWNSFTTKFFIKSQIIIETLEKTGKTNNVMTTEKCKQLMNSELKCHKCDHKPKNMPDLKKHILIHSK